MNSEKLWTWGFVNLLLFDIIYQFGAYMTNTIISVYAVALGASYGVAGLLAGLNPGSSMASRPIVGFIADILSKKTLIICSAAFFLIATLGCTFFTSVFLIGVCRVIQGISFALRSACVIALTGRVVPPTKLGAGMGWMGMSSVLSTAIGPVISESVGSAVGYQGSFLIASGFLAVGFVLACMIKRPPKTGDEKRPTIHSFKEAMHWNNFIYTPNIPYSALAMFSGVPQGISISLVILAATERGIEAPALFFTFYALTALIGRPLFGKLSDKFGTRKVIIPLFLIEMASVLVLMFMTNTAMVAIGGGLMGLGQGPILPLLQAESVRGVDPAEMGRAANTYYIGPDLNMCFSPIIGSMILSAFGVTALYGFGAASLLMAMLLFAWLMHHRRNQ